MLPGSKFGAFEAPDLRGESVRQGSVNYKVLDGLPRNQLAATYLQRREPSPTFHSGDKSTCSRQE